MVLLKIQQGDKMVISFCDACGKPLSANGVQGSAQFLPKGQSVGVTMCDTCWEKMTDRWNKINKDVKTYRYKVEEPEDVEEDS